MKEIEIIPIAAKKAGRRSITKKMIEDAVAHPMQIVAGYGGRKVAQNKIFIEGKEYLLRVVYEEAEDNIPW